jgi:hypothetical protein
MSRLSGVQMTRIVKRTSFTAIDFWHILSSTIFSSLGSTELLKINFELPPALSRENEKDVSRLK